MQEINNLASNVAGLRASVDQLQAAHEAGRIDRFQVAVKWQFRFARFGHDSSSWAPMSRNKPKNSSTLWKLRYTEAKRT